MLKRCLEGVHSRNMFPETLSSDKSDVTPKQLYIQVHTLICKMYVFSIAAFVERPGDSFYIKTPSYQYRKSHCGYKTILPPSYPHNGISYTGKMSSLYWIRAQKLFDAAVPKAVCDIWQQYPGCMSKQARNKVDIMLESNRIRDRNCSIFRHHYRTDCIVVVSWNIFAMHFSTRIVTEYVLGNIAANARDKTRMNPTVRSPRFFNNVRCCLRHEVLMRQWPSI